MANTAKGVIDKAKSAGITKFESDEQLRRWAKEKYEAENAKGRNYDPTRSALNFEIIDGKILSLQKDKSIPQRMREILSARGIKDPNTLGHNRKYITTIKLIIGGSRERMHEICFENGPVNTKDKTADNSHIRRSINAEKWAMDAYNFVIEKWGKENLVSFIVHLDETNPHIHCTLLPIVDGKFNQKAIWGGNDFQGSNILKKLHSEYYEKVGKKWGLSRGDSIDNTNAKHLGLGEYLRQLISEIGELIRKKDGLKTEISALEKQHDIAKRRVSGLSTMIKNRQEELEKLEHQIRDVENQISSSSVENSSLNERLKDLKKRHSMVEEELLDKQKKLIKAEQQLKSVQGEIEELKTRKEGYEQSLENLRKQRESSTQDFDKSIDAQLKVDFVGELKREIKMIFPKLEEALGNDDESLLMAFARTGEDFFKTASALVLNYVDEATQIAKGCGGGGTSSDLPWGKDKDEDEYLFRLRCLRHGAKMLYPSSRARGGQSSSRGVGKR